MFVLSLANSIEPLPRSVEDLSAMVVFVGHPRQINGMKRAPTRQTKVDKIASFADKSAGAMLITFACWQEEIVVAKEGRQALKRIKTMEFKIPDVWDRFSIKCIDHNNIFERLGLDLRL